MEVNSQLHALVVLTPGKEPRLHIRQRLGRLQRKSGCGDDEKEIPVRVPAGN